MRPFKVCPFCHRIVRFWQQKAYLDAKRTQPCHLVCLLRDIVKPERSRELVVMTDKGSWRRGVER